MAAERESKHRVLQLLSLRSREKNHLSCRAKHAPASRVRDIPGKAKDCEVAASGQSHLRLGRRPTSQF